MLDIQSWREIALPFNITCVAETIASGTLREQKFSGDFTVKMSVAEARVHVEMYGSFEVNVALNSNCPCQNQRFQQPRYNEFYGYLSEALELLQHAAR